MTLRIMLLPSEAGEDLSRAVVVPEGLDEGAAVHCARELIATAQRGNPDFDWDTDVAPLLERHGFRVVPLVLGPAWDGLA